MTASVIRWEPQIGRLQSEQFVGSGSAGSRRARPVVAARKDRSRAGGGYRRPARVGVALPVAGDDVIPDGERRPVGYAGLAEHPCLI